MTETIKQQSIMPFVSISVILFCIKIIVAFPHVSVPTDDEYI